MFLIDNKVGKIENDDEVFVWFGDLGKHHRLKEGVHLMRKFEGLLLFVLFDFFSSFEHQLAGGAVQQFKEKFCFSEFRFLLLAFFFFEDLILEDRVKEVFLIFFFVVVISRGHSPTWPEEEAVTEGKGEVRGDAGRHEEK